MSKIEDGGPAFPYIQGQQYCGMTLRDYFAIHAPEPSAEDVQRERGRDKSKNPYNEAHKPRLREDKEIRAYLRYACADAMLAARKGAEK